MRALVCGGRRLTDRHFVFENLDALHAKYRFTVIIHGDQDGADKLAGAWARLNGIDEDATPAGGTRFGHGAVFAARNTRMLLKRPEIVIAFPGGVGTLNMITQAELAGLPIKRVP